MILVSVALFSFSVKVKTIFSILSLGATMTFSNFGHGIYMANPTEVQKFSISSEFMRQLPEMRGRVFTDDVPMPEPPKPGFLKGASSFLFGNGKIYLWTTWLRLKLKFCEKDKIFLQNHYLRFVLYSNGQIYHWDFTYRIYKPRVIRGHSLTTLTRCG